MEQFLESIQPAQQFGAVSTASFPARLQKAREDTSENDQKLLRQPEGKTTEDAEERSGKPFSAHKFALMSADFNLFFTSLYFPELAAIFLTIAMTSLRSLSLRLEE